MLDRGMRGSPRPGRTRTICILLALFVPSAWADTTRGMNPAETPGFVRTLGPRRENSEGERALFRFLESEVQKRGLRASSIPISEYIQGHSFSSVLEVRIEGTGPGALAFVFPVNDVQTWGDGAEGVAAALDLMERMLRSPPPVEARFVFLGGDEGLAGSRAYAAYCADDPSLAVVRVEATADPGGTVQILIAGTGALSPFWLFDASVRVVRSRGSRDSVNANGSMIQRLGLGENPTPLDPWFERGIPAVTLRAGLSGPPGTAQEAPGIVQVLENLIRTLEAGVPDRWDKQYVLFEVWGFRVAVRETLFVVIVLILYAGLGLVFVLDSLRKRDLIAEELSRLPRAAAALAIVSATLFACVVATGALQSLILASAGSEEFWKVRPVAVSVLRLGQILTLFTALASLWARVGLLPRRAEFFRGSAVVLLGADVLLVSAARLALSPLYLWAFVAALLGRRTSRSLRSSWPAAISLPVMLIPLGLLAADLVRNPEPAVFERLLMPGPAGIAWIVFLSLPFLMALVGLGEGAFGSGFYAVRTASISAVLFLALSLAGGSLLVLDARRYSGVTELRLRETSDETAGTGTLRAGSPRPLPSFKVSKGAYSAEFKGGRGFETVEGVPADPRIQLSVGRTAFLDRVQLTLSIRISGEAGGIRITVPSLDSGSVYDTTFPFRSTEDGKGIVVSIGARPPNPLRVSLTVSRDFAALAEIAADFSDPSVPWRLDGPVRIREYSQESRLYVFLRGGLGPVP